MISYRDMTFCPFHKDCLRALRCHRPLYAEVERKARAWWGTDDPPIAVFAEKPECHTDYTPISEAENEEGHE